MKQSNLLLLLFIGNMSSIYAMEQDQADKKLSEVSDKLDVLVRILAHNSLETNQPNISSPFKIVVPKPRASKEKPVKIFRECYGQKLPLALEGLLNLLQYPADFQRNPGKVKNRILLDGPSGCGKTYMAKMLHEEFELPCMFIKATQLENEFYGGTSNKLSQLFETKSPNSKPLLVFIDEIDAVTPRRYSGLPQVYISAVNSFLCDLETTKGNPNFITMAATNRKYAMDPNVIRRFESVELKEMSDEEREKYIRKILATFPVKNQEESIETMLYLTSGLSKRDIEEAFNTAFAAAPRDEDKSEFIVTNELLKQAVAEKRKQLYVPLNIRFDNFLRDNQHYLSWINTIISAISLGHSIRNSMKADTAREQDLEHRAQDNQERKAIREQDLADRAIERQEMRLQKLLNLSYFDRYLRDYHADESVRRNIHKAWLLIKEEPNLSPEDAYQIIQYLPQPNPDTSKAKGDKWSL